MADHVRFLAVARVADRTLVATHAAEARGAARTRLEEKARMVLRSGRVVEQRRLTIADAEVGSIHYECDAACLYLGKYLFASCNSSVMLTYRARAVVTKMDYPQRTAFRMLSELARRFEDSFGAEFATARELSLSRTAGPLLSDLAKRYQDVATVDKVASVSVQVDAVKGVMQNNINAVLKVRPHRARDPWLGS